MSISDLYSSGEHKEDIGHFANIIKLALADDVVTSKERHLLDRMANRLNITDAEYKKILKNPEIYPINPPIDYDGRIERLYNLTNMIFADDEVTGDEAYVLRKIVVGLGFSSVNSEIVADEAIHLIMNNNDLEDFSKAIKNVNKN
ncbi:tellurite resistance TerB family protein [Urechidicola croceus]|uniref:Fructose 1,6-bisphosphatase n=1 Tax=Urechidicola croceus TaxID=1850246 RepID=A0A1D8P9F6_9FLAO|nr:hypothetical protein [Urechidicola croceus]AOW21199.1 hypothetical protein LPB138_11130 [Urechidicola croceus]